MESITRRRALASILFASVTPRTLFAADCPQSLSSTFAALEAKSGGKLGCAVFGLDTNKHTGQCIGHRIDERFPMCSTFKFLVTSFVLKRVDAKQEHLDRRITYTKADLLSYAPVAEKHVNSGMTIAELCEAAMTLSDNTAANLLLTSFGGPPALNNFLRSIGDSTTRLDRTEPSLNEAAAGDPRDTTTPSAMLEDLHRILFGDVLDFSSRTQLTDWMMANKTGDARLRAGLPHSWKVGDKTGTGDHGTTNDIAVLWPPHHPPVLITAYLTQSTLNDASRNAILADVARTIAGTIA